MRFRNRSTIAKGISIIFCFLGLFSPGQLSSSNPEDLTILHIGTVAPNILGITIQAGQVRYGEQVPYVQQAGDTAEKWIDPGWGWLKRNGRFIGARVGPKGDLLQTFDQVVGERLNTNWADKPKNYRIQSVDDPRYGKPLSPLAVYRKSKPSDLARTRTWEFDAPQEHVIHLKLPFPLTPGKNYQITSRENFLPQQSFPYEPVQLRSEAVHISQIGFRPDDPVKIAFLSCWLGNGGGVDYSKIGNFQVLNHNSGETVFEGKLHLSKAGRDQTEDPYKRNYNLVDVYEMDFSKLNQPGTYRVYVEGVGCSIPFQIGPKVWSEAFRIAAKSFYHQRSGIALGPPYTNFIRPRCFSPDDGVKVYASTCALIDSGNGLNAKGTDKDNFGNLVKGKTGQPVPDAWGGYFDAGDWDRRIQHLDATRLLLELAELFPEFSGSSSLNLPESGNGLPDLLNEALWIIGQ
jgi:endoglucanase